MDEGNIHCLVIWASLRYTKILGWPTFVDNDNVTWELKSVIYLN